MDTQQNSKPKNSNNNSILKMLPKAMSFGQRLAPFSPRRDLHHHQSTSTSTAAAAAGNRAFLSGPITRLVPVEARLRKSKNDGVMDEPTSPKVSCIGQIKLAKTKCSDTKKKPHRVPPAKPKTASSRSKDEDRARPSMIKRMFSSAGAKPPEKPPPAAASAGDLAGDRPSLGQMKKFASSREAFAGFDWAAEMKSREESPATVYRRREYFSDDEERVIAFSAPLPLNETEGLKPKKEINLWKRRTMNPPRPLQIKDG
ncbi:PREDICTED: uncharacterized protein At1g76070 [Tarenaya hassleriana]|uniref:uncharacterized protein At1g76070 n=1 Tax=Tarenaya hassleriana TaxID=28532 RepID=UPI00053C6FB4|nr:PREDICTED: uncharacterized protein At1g76070 [Tarenaya hassleriana]